VARGVRAPLATAAVVGAALAVLALRDPHVAGSYGECPLVAFTGLWCPLCGGLRATWDLLHGDVAGAWSMNVVVTVALPVLVVAWGWWLAVRVRARTLPAWVRSPRLPVVALGLLVVFGVLRNLPALAPVLAPH